MRQSASISCFSYGFVRLCNGKFAIMRFLRRGLHFMVDDNLRLRVEMNGVIKGMGFWTLLEGCLLLANAFAILNEERFLVPRGWSFQEFSGVRRNSMKGQLIGLIYAVQYMRIPLMAANIVVIALKIVTG
ncbi:hypothetical protein RHSIM_Rhsim09G0171200 [Rhododendron simsii]|uniref:Yos1-like protein n=1 Tax=Rhododendron simsii TaxID=118357 RepID=A0A834GJK3_RHOSS|nr:hypothetical protein RHSIM_Rhsim09G0171200 [Rhododendron simsii]